MVGRPAPARIIFDAGSKTLTSDAARGFTTLLGHGLVYTSLDAADPDRAIIIERLSEEHAVARVTAECTLRPGDVVRIIPNHACTVTNLADTLVLTESGANVGRLPVSARGRNF